jgi:hypothetical protein
MRKFRVIVSRRERFSVLVEAENEEQAKIIAQSDSNKLNYKNLQDQGSLWVDDIYEEDEDEAA